MYGEVAELGSVALEVLDVVRAVQSQVFGGTSCKHTRARLMVTVILGRDRSDTSTTLPDRLESSDSTTASPRLISND